jgi:hypothetical protein
MNAPHAHLPKAAIAMAIVSLLIAGCSTAYHSTGLTGGFKDMQLATNVWRISFQGNAYTSAERAWDFAMLRACELTQQNGYPRFAVATENNSVVTSSFSTPATATTSMNAYGTTSGTLYGNQYHGNTYLSGSSYTTYDPGQTYTFNKPNSAVIIVGLHEEQPGTFTYDSAFLCKQLTNRYGIKLKSP